MNIFRLIADMLHLASFYFLISKIHKSKNCLGISYRSQEIYLVVFLARYWDLFLYFVSLYNTIMKVLYISATAYIIYLMKVKKPFSLSYDEAGDNFEHYKYIYPGAALATLLLHTDITPFELSWSFSIWLEAIAIVPQLFMISKVREIENITGNYMAALGFYRFFYILNWVLRYYVEKYFCYVSFFGGLIQTILYADFLYYYIVWYTCSNKAKHQEKRKFSCLSN